MSLSSFQFVAAAMVLGSIALVVLILLVARTIGRSRRENAVEGAPVEAAAKPSRKGLGRKAAAEPEPPAEPAVARPRRRQISSFAETERLAEEAEPADAAFEQAPEPAQPAAEPDVFAEPEAGTVPADEPVAETAAPDRDAPDLNSEVLGRLEELFEALQAGELTLDAYREHLLTEAAAVEQRIAELEPAGAGPQLESALAAKESVLWCLDWAAEQARAED